MLTLFNFSNDYYDQSRFANADDFRDYLNSFGVINGIELLSLSDLPTVGHPNQADRMANWPIPDDLVFGLHARSVPHWLDFWQGNQDVLRQTYPTIEIQDRYYGSSDPQILVDMLEEDANHARSIGASYLVWHVSESSPRECLTRKFNHSSAEVIDASLEILNAVNFSGLTLLLENLWYPGLTLTEPKMTKRLLDGLNHSNSGIMLDTGHLAHTNTDLRSQEQAVSYINQILDSDPVLPEAIRGIHLNMSLSGEYVRAVCSSPPPPPTNYDETMNQLFEYVFNVDLHQPFIAPGVSDLIQRVAPEWLTLEFITSDRKTHEQCIKDQLKALANTK
jgi:hypothetical protein